MSKIDVVSEAEIEEVIQAELAKAPADRDHAHIMVAARTEEGMVPFSHRVYDRDIDDGWTRTGGPERTSSSTRWSRTYASNWERTFRGGN